MSFFKPFKFKDSYERGTSLISILIAAGIAGFVALTISKVTTNGLYGAKSIAERQDLEAIKQTIRTRLDCPSSLNVTSSTTLPLTCSSYGNVTLRRSDNTSITDPNGFLGEWQIQAGCINNRITVRATRSGNDPLTQKPWSNVVSNSVTGETISTDLFGGTTDFCREFFVAGASCSGTYASYMGIKKNGEALCCRRVLGNSIADSWGGQYSVAQCGNQEYIHSGGGECINYAAHAFLHASTVVPRGSSLNNPWFVAPISNAAYADCYGMNETTLAREERDAGAVAICCPL